MSRLARASEGLRARYARMPLSVQFIGTYLLVMAIMFGALMPVSARARRIAMENYLNERRYALETSAAAFERQIDTFRRIPLTMQQSSYYMELRLLDRAALANRHYFALSKLQNLFRLQCSQLELPTNGFVIFSKNNFALADEYFFTNAEECFTTHLAYGQSAGEILSLCKAAASSQAFLPAQPVSINGAAEKTYLTYLCQQRDESAIYGMLLEESALRSLFRLTELPEDLYFAIETADGAPLYTVGAREDEASFVFLKNSRPSIRCVITLGIPNAYFQRLIRPLTQLNLLYAIVAIAIGTALSLLFTLANVRPLRRLLRITSGAAGDGWIKNEYQALDQSIRRSMKENQRLQTQIRDNKALLRVNLFSRLLVQETYGQAEEALAEDYLPQLKERCRLLALRLTLGKEGEAEADLIGYRALEVLGGVCAPGSLVAQISRVQFVVLFVDEEDALAWAQGAALALGECLAGYGATVGAGVSDAFSSLEKLHAAYLHALFCMRFIGDGEIPVFSPTGPKEEEASFQFMDLHRYHNAILACEAESALAILSAMMETLRLRFERGEEALWLPNAAIFVLDSIRGDMGLTLQAQKTRAPLQARSFSAIHKDLRARTCAVIDALAAKKNTYAGDFVLRVQSFLEAQYADASLSTDSVAERFNVSKSYLYRVMKEATGMTISDMLEQIRMERAGALLSTTRLSVADIAAACGYHSANTFYKAYKKRHGVSPNAGRTGEG